MNENFVDSHSFVIEQLRDPEVARGYLNLALEDENPKYFLRALNNVIEAFYGKEAVLNQACVSREELLNILNQQKQPERCMQNIFLALGISVVACHPENNVSGI